jgi:hypothetical protein
VLGAGIRAVPGRRVIRRGRAGGRRRRGVRQTVLESGTVLGRRIRFGTGIPRRLRRARPPRKTTTRRGSRLSVWLEPVQRSSLTRSSGRCICRSHRPRSGPSRSWRAPATIHSPTSAIRSALAEVSADSPIANPNSLAGEFWRQGWAFRLFGGLFLRSARRLWCWRRRDSTADGVHQVLAARDRRPDGARRQPAERAAHGLWQGAGVSVSAWRSVSGPGGLGTQMRALLSNVSPPIRSSLTTTAVTPWCPASEPASPALRASSVDP